MIGRAFTLPSMSEQHLLPIYDRYPLEVECGRGCNLFDTAGRRYLDMASGIGVNAFGYAHPRITAALREQAGLCVHTSNLVGHRYQGELAEKLCRISGLDRAFFSNSGTEAMEAALKAARARGLALEPQKTRLVALRGSFHGRTHGSLAVTGQPELRRLFEPLGAAVTFIDPNDGEGLAAAVSAETAAVVVEPVLGEGGIYPLAEGFLRQAREVTGRCGALLVADETQCGLGRTGRYFAYQWAGIQPDIAVTAKPLAAGLPLGATLFTEEASRHLPAHSHGTTFGGGPLACRVALEFLSLLEEVLPRIEETGARFRACLEQLRHHPAVGEIRSKGLMFGIQLARPGLPVVLAAMERGLVVNCTQGNVIRLLPPYIVTEEEIEEAVGILDEALSAALSDRPLPCPVLRSPL
ncbi:MAG: acetylornithine transaminase [Acidobacteriia bacterium]|nr:acetylornithine transaminase [Terriglobia bacterium]